MDQIPLEMMAVCLIGFFWAGCACCGCSDCSGTVPDCLLVTISGVNSCPDCDGDTDFEAHVQRNDTPDCNWTGRYCAFCDFEGPLVVDVFFTSGFWFLRATLTVTYDGDDYDIVWRKTLAGHPDCNAWTNETLDFLDDGGLAAAGGCQTNGSEVTIAVESDPCDPYESCPNFCDFCDLPAPDEMLVTFSGFATDTSSDPDCLCGVLNDTWALPRSLAFPCEWTAEFEWDGGECSASLDTLRIHVQLIGTAIQVTIVIYDSSNELVNFSSSGFCLELTEGFTCDWEDEAFGAENTQINFLDGTCDTTLAGGTGVCFTNEPVTRTATFTAVFS